MYEINTYMLKIFWSSLWFFKLTWIQSNWSPYLFRLLFNLNWGIFPVGCFLIKTFRWYGILNCCMSKENQIWYILWKHFQDIRIILHTNILCCFISRARRTDVSFIRLYTVHHIVDSGRTPPNSDCIIVFLTKVI